LGAYEVGADLPHYGPRDARPLILSGIPADQTIYLSWQLNTTLSGTATWQIGYIGPDGDEPSPIASIPNPTRAYTLTGLTNYTPYTITLNAIVDSAAIMTDTVSIMPTDLFVYLPLANK
jgi:hypothetical protein